MKTAEQVDKLVVDLKNGGVPLSEAAWQTALACVGWPYVFGAWGAYCTVAERKKRYRDSHPTIKTKCKAYDGGSCDGCTWYPGGKRVRCFDCRGFTDWVLKQFGIDLEGEGTTSQWNTNSNWKAKGLVSEGVPQGVIVCLFYQKKSNPKKMAHTGFGYNGETCECSSGVQHATKMNEKWTHWAIPNGIDDEIKPAPKPEPTPSERPILRKGSKGPYVVEAQTLLMERGYKLPKYGPDGSYGNETMSAVKEFQKDWNLQQDGVIGQDTWEMLLTSSKLKIPKYSVTIRGLDLTQATALQNNYPGSEIREE